MSDKLPNVATVVTNKNLGRVDSGNDGICGLIGHGIATVKFALGDVLTLVQLADAEALGIDEAYDTTNTVMLWHHIRDFYDEAPSGTTLYVMPVAKTVTMAQMLAKDGVYAPALLQKAGGDIRILAVTSVTETWANIVAAIPIAQLLYKQSFDLYMPHSILLEGRDCPDTLNTIDDLRNDETGPDANRVSVVISQDLAVAATAPDANYANVCHALGRAAAVPVQRNIGRVKDGRLASVTTPALSNGTKIADLTQATLDTVNGKGFIFMRNHVGKSGAFFNGDHCACPIDDDYYGLGRGRTMDKAVRIVRDTYVEELLDDIEIDPDNGKIAPDVVKAYQQAANSAIEANMMQPGSEEISGKSVYVNPEQDVQATDKVAIKLKIVPKGTVKAIEVELGYSKTV